MNTQNTNTTTQIATKSFAGTFSGCLGIFAGINAAWIVGCILLIVLLLCCCGSMAFLGSIAPTNQNETNLNTQTSVTPTNNNSNEKIPTTTSPTITSLFNINTYRGRPMTVVAKELNTQIKKGNGIEIDRMVIEKPEYNLVIESDSTKSNASYVAVTIKNQPKCEKTSYSGMQKFDENLRLVSLDPSLKGDVELYFNRSYAAWTKNYNKDFTVNTGCNSDGFIYLNFGLTKCGSLVNGKPVEGC